MSVGVFKNATSWSSCSLLNRRRPIVVSVFCEISGAGYHGAGFRLKVILVATNLLERLDVGQHERRDEAPDEEDERARAPTEPERWKWLSGATQLRLPEA